jgi:uncharacterized membrane-anchored protein
MHKAREKIMLVLLVIVLWILNYGIYKKEHLKKQGETVFLALDPYRLKRYQDSDFLIQEREMPLHYAFERTLSKKDTEVLSEHQKKGYIVMRADANNVGQFVRFHKKEVIGKGEKLFRFYKRDYWNFKENEKSFKIFLTPDSFFFKKGLERYYKNACYGVFKYDDSGDYLLIGLADHKREIILVPEESFKDKLKNIFFKLEKTINS